MTIQINNISFFGYERKFRVDELTKEEVELIIKKNVGHFNEIFHQRVINNIYLDTQSFSNYTDNLDGIPEKIKITPKLQKLLDEREVARSEKNWAESDRLRDETQKLGYQVSDTDGGQVLTPLT